MPRVLVSIPRLATGISLALVAAGSEVKAEEIERIAVTYEAHPLCPNEDAFVGEIAARTSRFRRVPEGGGGRTIRVRLREEEGHAGTRGELVLAEGDAESVRVVHDESCAVVVSGLALIAALAIDPEAETGPVGPIAPPPAGPPEAPPPPPVAVLSPPAAPVADAREGARRSLRGAVVAGMAGRVGVVPASAAVTIAGVVGLVTRSRKGTSLVSPEARLELSLGAPRTEDAGGPAARLQWFGGHLEGCGLFGVARLRGGPCGLVEVGAVHAEGLAIGDAQSTTRVGASLGGGLRGALTIGAFQAGIGAFVLVPLRRDRFYVDPSLTLFRTSALGGQVGADVGVHF